VTQPANSASPPPGSSRAALSGADHVQGSTQAVVTLGEYGDYECPACIQAEPMTRHLMESFGDRLRFVFRHYPLLAVHPHAELAAEAAEAAAAQGQFWAMHHLLFVQKHHLKPAALDGYAQTIGLDMLRFKAEMADRIYTQRVHEHRRAAERTGTRSTPTFFLNGALVDVSAGLQHLETAVVSALAAASRKTFKRRR
jgi:protein-disulfide isomerase